MGTTNGYGLHYPESTYPPNGAGQMQQLAEDVDDTFTNFNTRINQLDSGWQDITSQCTPMNSSTLAEVSVRRYGPIVAVYATVTLGIAINVPTSGNTTNTELFLLPTAWGSGNSLNHQQYVGGSGATGSVCNFLIDPSDNAILISATTPGTALNVGSTLNVSGMFFTDR